MTFPIHLSTCNGHVAHLGRRQRWVFWRQLKFGQTKAQPPGWFCFPKNVPAQKLLLQRSSCDVSNVFQRFSTEFRIVVRRICKNPARVYMNSVRGRAPAWAGGVSRSVKNLGCPSLMREAGWRYV